MRLRSHWPLLAALCAAACTVHASPAGTETSGAPGTEGTTAGTTGAPTGTTAEPAVTTAETTGSTGTPGESTGATTGDDPTAGSTSGDTPEKCPQHESVDACCCFVQGYRSVYNVCHTVTPCPTVEFLCDGQNGCVPDNGEGDLDCVLHALADAKPGTFTIKDDSTDLWRRSIEYFSVGDGTAFKIEHSLNDLDGKFEDTRQFMLRPASFFAQCLAGSVADKFVCLHDAVGEPIGDVCIPGFKYIDY